jgi:hypothetical protein
MSKERLDRYEFVRLAINGQLVKAAFRRNNVGVGGFLQGIAQACSSESGDLHLKDEKECHEMWKQFCQMTGDGEETKDAIRCNASEYKLGLFNIQAHKRENDIPLDVKAD